MTVFIWFCAITLAAFAFAAGALVGRDVYDAVRRKWPTNGQRHTLPAVRSDRRDWDATEGEVLLFVEDLATVRQPADWLDEGPTLPLALPPVPVIPGQRPYRARHRAEDQTPTERFERIAADEGAPVRVHGPRETVAWTTTPALWAEVS